LGEEDIVQPHKGRIMSWMGHVWRSSGIMKDALNWKPEGKRPTNPTRISGYLGLKTRRNWQMIERDGESCVGL